MLSYNTNYGQMSNAVLNDSQTLLNDPEQLTTDGELSFMSALWYYMYPQYPKPSMHDVMLGFFEPSQADIDANICTGCFGTTTNLINAQECGQQSMDASLRADYFEDFCDELGGQCPLFNTECID